MALTRTLTISTTTFERMKEKFDGFRQTVPDTLKLTPKTLIEKRTEHLHNN